MCRRCHHTHPSRSHHVDVPPQHGASHGSNNDCLKDHGTAPSFAFRTQQCCVEAISELICSPSRAMLLSLHPGAPETYRVPTPSMFSVVEKSSAHAWRFLSGEGKLSGSRRCCGAAVVEKHHLLPGNVCISLVRRDLFLFIFISVGWRWEMWAGRFIEEPESESESIQGFHGLCLFALFSCNAQSMECDCSIVDV